MRLTVIYNPLQWNDNQDTFCIEIKPKQGWTLRECNPNPFPGIDVNGIDKCRYCAMQYWKVFEMAILRPEREFLSFSSFCCIAERRKDSES